VNHDANLNHSANASQRANLTHSVESLITLEPPEESTDIDLRDASDRVEITTDLPDCSAEDVRVIAAGRDVRIRATPSGEESTSIDRTITLSETVTDANVAVSYDDPTLTVTVRKSSQRR
jgi:HSP20 family molecular chaperone IbpA